MRCLLLLFFLIICQSNYAQKSFLFIKKNGKKVRTFYEGDKIKIQVGKDFIEGYIATLKNDSIYINRMAFNKKDIKTIFIKREKRPGTSAKQIAIVTAAVAVSTAGMTLSKYETFGNALQSSATIGYAPLIISEIQRHVSLKRKKYRLGKKFYLQVLDFYLPVQQR